MIAEKSALAAYEALRLEVLSHHFYQQVALGGTMLMRCGLAAWSRGDGHTAATLSPSPLTAASTSMKKLSSSSAGVEIVSLMADIILRIERPPNHVRVEAYK